MPWKRFCCPRIATDGGIFSQYSPLIDECGQITSDLIRRDNRRGHLPTPLNILGEDEEFRLYRGKPSSRPRFAAVLQPAPGVLCGPENLAMASTQPMDDKSKNRSGSQS